MNLFGNLRSYVEEQRERKQRQREKSIKATANMSFNLAERGGNVYIVFEGRAVRKLDKEISIAEAVSLLECARKNYEEYQAV